jgi:hypothetical protein
MSYRKAELLHTLRAAGYPRSEGWLRDWQNLGLASRGRRPGRGQRRGRDEAQWEEAELEIVLSLLTRQSKGDSIPQLCEIVVQEWRRGDVAVATKQAMRALRAWAPPYSRPSRREARQRAADILAALARESDVDARPRDRNRAERELTAFLYDRETPPGDKAEHLWAQLTAPVVDAKRHRRGSAQREFKWAEIETITESEVEPVETSLLRTLECAGNPRPALQRLALRFEALYRLPELQAPDFDRARRTLALTDTLDGATSTCELLLEFLPRPSGASHRVLGGLGHAPRGVSRRASAGGRLRSTARREPASGA